jgi:single-stranded-DNA-specific exonuclease
VSKRWLVAEPITPQIKQQFPELDGALLQLLWNREVKTQEEIDVFLGPDWSRDTYDPSLFSRMSEAVARVFGALERDEVITIHGDYDADGTCGTAVLVITLRNICRALSFAYNVTTYIPDREKEGYGMSIETVEHLAEHDKTKLVITVDCGISNKPAIDRAHELGIDTIVCDHHTMPPELPRSAILIHPLVPGETFPNKHLCGTGVAFKLASALIVEARKRGANFPDGYEKWLLDLVAIATVTDVMPLTGENRVLEKFGLLVLNKTRRPGIQKLLDVSGSIIGELDTVSIGFQIGPRINAAGRMTHANEALDLLIEEDPDKATQLAMRLHEINKERQQASQAMYLQAKRQVGERPQSLIVVYQEGWGAGLVGLVAGKLVNDYHIPAFVVGQDGDKFVGSGRSVEGFDVTKALHHASEYLDRFGGHPQACGFSVTSEERFHKAIQLMRDYAAQNLKPEDIEPILHVDAQIELDAINWELFDAIQQLRPFGQANAVPVFATHGVRVSSFSTVGKDGGHLKLRLQSQTGKLIEAIGFRFGEWASKLTMGIQIDVAYEVQVNEWNGNRQLQIRIVDLRLS